MTMVCAEVIILCPRGDELIRVQGSKMLSGAVADAGFFRCTALFIWERSEQLVRRTSQCFFNVFLNEMSCVVVCQGCFLRNA